MAGYFQVVAGALVSAVILCLVTPNSTKTPENLAKKEKCIWDSERSFAENIHCYVRRHKRQAWPRYDRRRNEAEYDIYGHPCTSYLRLVQPERRVGNRINSLTDSALCDRTLKRRWYRFEGPAGGVMPETCIEEYNCGTHAPIWLNGEHPAFYGETLDIPVCASLSGDCCTRRWYIRVANCGDFYTYLLTDTPGCFMAYCAGIQEPCPPGQSSVTGFGPGCSENFPHLEGEAELHIGEEGHQVAFYCDYDGPIPTNIVLETEWFVKGENYRREDEDHFPIFVDSMRGRRRSTLEEGHWAGKMGSTIHCRIRARWLNGTGVPSPFLESEKYFAGIKISKRVVEVSESDQEAVIQVQSTMPVTCLPQYRDACKVTIELAHDPEIGGKKCIAGDMEQVVFGDCSIDITPSNWQDVHNVTIKAVRDFYNDGTKNMRVNFKPVYSTYTSGLWNDYELPEVQVIAKDTHDAMCTSTGDPHYLTFDGFYYHVYLEGEFVLYKNKRMPIQINTRLEECGKTVTCNCGVAVKAADDVIVIDRCKRRNRNLAYGSSFPEGWRTLHRHALEQNGDFVEGLVIYEYDDGRRYTIHLPTGAYLDFRVGEHWVNIYLHASSDDWRSTLGLCGTFDEDANNDLLYPDGVTRGTANHHDACGESEEICQFAEAWRVADADSFFGPVVEVPVEDHTFFSDQKYCKCEKQANGQSNVVCNFHYDVHNCQGELQKRKGVDRTNDVMIKSKSRFRRDVTDTWSDDVIDYFGTQFVYNATFKGQVPSWPTPSGITESYARTYCYDVITKSQASRVCNRITDDKLNMIIDECMTDIKVTDDKSWSAASLSVYTEDCEAKVHQNADFWKSPVTTDNTDSSGQGESTMDATEAASLLMEICPSDCSQHGRCYQGKCDCSYGYEGDDCSIMIFQPPQIQHVSEDGLCDIFMRPCEKIKVYGSGFRNISDVQCHFRDINDNVISSDVEFVTFEELFCKVPKPKRIAGTDFHVAMTTYTMFITGNGYRSNDKTAVIFDSRCYSCDRGANTGQCQRQNISCIVEDICYGSSDKNPLDCCEVCDPSISNDQFTAKRATRKMSLHPRQGSHVTYQGDTWKSHFRAFGGSGCPAHYTTQNTGELPIKISYGKRDLVVEFQAFDEGNYTFTVNAQDPCGSNTSRTYTLNVKPNPSAGSTTEHLDCSNNRRPYFENETESFRMVPNEVLNVKVKAQDDDNDTLEYYVIKNTDTYVSITKDGVLRYHAKENVLYDALKVFAVDPCQNKGFLNLNINLQSCKCTNGGTCEVPIGSPQGSGHYECHCPEGFTGERCEVSLI